MTATFWKWTLRLTLVYMEFGSLTQSPYTYLDMDEAHEWFGVEYRFTLSAHHHNGTQHAHSTSWLIHMIH